MVREHVYSSSKYTKKPVYKGHIQGGDSMNFYVSVINSTVEYIEQSINENLQLAELSSIAGISDFHFNRIFKTVAGISLKQYILGRKLTRAGYQLKTTDKSILEIALDFGFEYPEVFSRAFKKQFGISPLQYRKQHVNVKEIKKATIVERDIINYRGTLALKGSSVRLDSIELRGVSVQTNINSIAFKEELKDKTETFILNSSDDSCFYTNRFYTIVTCSGKEDGEHTVFCGRKAKPIENIYSLYQCFLVPEGWYADFIYSGDMFDIRDVFIDDLYKWIMLKEAKINPNGIGMLNIYDNNYPANSQVHILVPLKKPV